MCSALSAVLQQVETSLFQPALTAVSLVDSELLKCLSCAWEACTVAGLKEHASLPYIERLLAAAASMVRIAAALGGWQQEGR